MSSRYGLPCRALLGTILLVGSSSEIPFALKSNAESRSPVSRCALCSQEISGAVQVRRMRINFNAHLQRVLWNIMMRAGACALQVNVHIRGRKMFGFFC